MNYVTKFIFALGLMLPSFAWSMNSDDLKAIEARRQKNFDSDDGSEDDWENNSSLNNSIISPRKKDDVKISIDQKDQQNKAVAFEKAGGANNALTKKAEEMARTFSEGKITPKTIHNSAYDQKSGIEHSNKPVKLDDVENEEWEDGMNSAPEVPPFNEYAPENKNIDLDIVAPANSNAHNNNNNEYEVSPPVPPRDDEQPTIVTMPDPDASKLPNYSDDEDDLPNSHLPQQPGVKEERNLNRRPIPKNAHRTNNRPFANSVPVTPTAGSRNNREIRSNGNVQRHIAQFENVGTPRQPVPPLQIPVQTTSETATLQNPVSTWNITPLLISAGLFGILTYAHQTLASHQKTEKNKTAQEFVHGAQQAAAANTAQQMLPGKSANPTTFTTLFCVLHACELGLKKAAQSVLAKTKAGKKIAMKLRKMPKQKRSILKTSGMAASWLFKTLIARALTA